MEKFLIILGVFLLSWVGLSYGEEDVIITPPIGAEYDIRGEMQSTRYHFFYGSKKDSISDREFAWIIGYDRQNIDRTMEFLVDESEVSFFEFAMIYEDNTIGLVMTSIEMNSRTILIFTKTKQLVKLDDNFNWIESKEIPSTNHEYYTFSNQLILIGEDSKIIYNQNFIEQDELLYQSEYYNQTEIDYSGSVVINDQQNNDKNLLEPGIYHIILVECSEEIDIIIHPIILGVMDGVVYNDEITISSSGLLTLNGDEYISGTIISEPGNYELEVFGVNGYHKLLQFVMKPYIEPIYDGYQTTNMLTINSNALKIYINEEEYLGGYIVDAGVYVVRLEGINEYQEELQFEILPSVLGIENNQIYTSIISFYVNGEAYLNDQLIEDNNISLGPGIYELNLYRRSSIYHTYIFEVTSEEISDEENAKNKTVIMFEYILVGVSLVGLILIFKKK